MGSYFKVFFNKKHLIKNSYISILDNLGLAGTKSTLNCNKFLAALVPNNDSVFSSKDILQQEKKLLGKKVREQGDSSETMVGRCSSLPSSPYKQEYVNEKYKPGMHFDLSKH